MTTALRRCDRLVSAIWPRACETAVREALADGWRIDRANRYCRRCGASAGPHAAGVKRCGFCCRRRVAWHRIVRLSSYQEPMDQWITAMKFAGDWSWARWFGRRLAEQCRHTLVTDEARTVVCPVPMHWLRRCHRGYNQSFLIAESLAKARRLPMARLLRRTRRTPPQTAVEPRHRFTNVRGSFAAVALDLTGWHVLLVDDVKTTGATLAACTDLLHEHGAERVTAVVAAAADPKGMNFHAT